MGRKTKAQKERDTVVARSVGDAAAGDGRSDRIEVRDPIKCARILERIARGDATRVIMREEDIGHAMIARLKIDHGEAIGKRRELAAVDAEQLAEQYRLIAQDKAEMLAGDEEMLSKVNPKDLALSYGIYRDKASQLRGEATVTIEHKKQVSLEDAKAAIEAARKVVNAEVVDV